MGSYLSVQAPAVPRQAWGAQAFDPIAARAFGSGGGPSGAGLQQALTLQRLQQQQAAASGAPLGTNRALGALRSSEAAAQSAGGLLAQGAQARMQEQMMARQALMEAQFRQRQMQAQEAQALNAAARQQAAANMAQQGAMISGAFGLAGLGLQGYGQYTQQQQLNDLLSRRQLGGAGSLQTSLPMMAPPAYPPVPTGVLPMGQILPAAVPTGIGVG